MENQDDRVDLILLGRNLGTNNGWDECAVDALNFYDFIPGDGVTIPATTCLYVDFGKGIYECYADDPDATVFEKGDLITALRDLPIVE